MTRGVGHKNWHGYRDNKGRWVSSGQDDDALRDTLAEFMTLASKWMQELYQLLEVDPQVKVLLQAWMKHNLDSAPIKFYGNFRKHCIESGYVQLCPACEGARIHVTKEKRCLACGGRGWLPNDVQVSAEEISVD